MISVQEEEEELVELEELAPVYEPVDPPVSGFAFVYLVIADTIVYTI